jgi:hypothetical protein
MVRKGSNAYYLKNRPNEERIVTYLTDSNRGNDDDFLIVAGNWEIGRDEPEHPKFHIPTRFGVIR